MCIIFNYAFMKKYIFIFFAICSCFYSYAQLNIVKQDIVFKNEYFNVTFENECFVLNVLGARNNQTITINLGRTKDEAKVSISQIVDWFNNAHKKDYITIQQDKLITLYKYSKEGMFITEGDNIYCDNLPWQIGVAISNATSLIHNDKPTIGFVKLVDLQSIFAE